MYEIILKLGAKTFIKISWEILMIKGYSIDNHPMWKELPTEECGRGRAPDRIIGGQDASLGQYPWIARLVYDIPGISSRSFLCAGSLVNKWFVVTAKHCFRQWYGPHMKYVRLGENFANEDKDCENSVCATPVQDIPVEWYRVNPQTNPSKPVKKNVGTYADVALIKLATPAVFNDFVSPICLPRGKMLTRTTEYLKDKMLEVAGWGTVEALKFVYPNKLQYVHVPWVESSKCQSVYRSSTVDKTTICLGQGQGHDSCGGDSGGPAMLVVAENGPPRYYLFGAVSYGAKTCGKSPAVYTNISHFMGWMLDNMVLKK